MDIHQHLHNYVPERLKAQSFRYDVILAAISCE